MIVVLIVSLYVSLMTFKAAFFPEYRYIEKVLQYLRNILELAGIGWDKSLLLFSHEIGHTVNTKVIRGN